MSEKNNFINKEVLNTFFAKSRKCLKNLEYVLMEIEEKEQSNENLNNIFRTIHTIKGSSSMFCLTHIEKLTHVIEAKTSFNKFKHIVRNLSKQSNKYFRTRYWYACCKKSLSGSITLDSEEGVGTTTKITLPLTLSIIDGFLCKIGGGNYVIPLNLVYECIERKTEDLVKNKDIDYIDLHGHILPLINDFGKKIKKRNNIMNSKITNS